MLAQVLKKQPGLFLYQNLDTTTLLQVNISPLVTYWAIIIDLQAAISSLTMPEQHPVKSAASFLSNLISGRVCLVCLDWRISDVPTFQCQEKWSPWCLWSTPTGRLCSCKWWSVLGEKPAGPILTTSQISSSPSTRNISTISAGKPTSVLGKRFSLLKLISGTWTVWSILRASPLKSALEIRRSILLGQFWRRELTRGSCRRPWGSSRCSAEEWLAQSTRLSWSSWDSEPDLVMTQRHHRLQFPVLQYLKLP